MNWQAKNKYDLIVEVWEKLDCENVGSAEIEAIEIAVEDVYGQAAVDPPMRIARLLADEGAELRHSEIMDLHIKRSENKPYTAEFRNIYRLDSLKQALRSIRALENLRRKFAADGDKTGIRLIRERTIVAKNEIKTGSDEQREIAEWLTVWLQTPEVFENWIALRQRSAGFRQKFQDKL